MPIPNPVAFTIFGLDVRWYGILMATSIVTASLITMYRSPKHNWNADIVLDILIFAIPAGILGARIYYVVFQWSYYGQHPAEIFNFRGGGLAVHGALLAAFLAAYLVCRHKKISFLDGLDLTVPAIALAQAIGRWGNYFNSEAHGGHTDLPWAITVGGDTVHPTFLYESLWCLLLFFVLLAVDNRRTFVGQTFSLYLILYSVERILVEGLRTDSLMIGPFRQAQVLSFTLIVLGILFYFLFKKIRPLNYTDYMAGGFPDSQVRKNGKPVVKAVKKLTDGEV